MSARAGPNVPASNSNSNSSICSAPPTISPMAHSIVSGRSVLSWTGMSLGDAWMLLSMTARVSVPSATDSTQGVWRHFVCRSQLSQPVVSCRQQPKATSITRKDELSHMAHGHLQFLDLQAGTYFRHLWSHRRRNPLIFVNSWRQYSWRSRRNYVTRVVQR